MKITEHQIDQLVQDLQKGLAYQLTTVVIERLNQHHQGVIKLGLPPKNSPLRDELKKIIGETDYEQVRQNLQALVDKTTLANRQMILTIVNDQIHQETQTFRAQVLERVEQALIKESIWHRTCLIQAYPANTRFIAANGNRAIFVIEQLPLLRMVHFDSKMIKQEFEALNWQDQQKFFKQQNQTSFSLSLPWVVFFIVINVADNFFDRLLIFFRNEPLVTLDDALLDPAFPNIFASNSGNQFEMCIGDLYLPAVQQFDNLPLAQWTEWLLESLWQAQFNADNLSFWNDAQNLDERIQSPWHWEQASRINPNFATQVAWSPAARTPRDVITQLLKHSKDNATMFSMAINKAIGTVAEDISASINNAIEKLPASNCFSPLVDRALAEQAQTAFTTFTFRFKSLIAQKIQEIIEAKFLVEMMGKKITEILEGHSTIWKEVTAWLKRLPKSSSSD